MADNTSIPKLVTVFGGSGFVGRHTVRALAKRGYRVRVACRNPNLASHLQPLGNVGQIHAVQANLRHRWSVDRACEGADHVVNLVAILHEGGRQTFDAVHEFGARAVAETARGAGAGLTHMSAIGADAGSASGYASTKAKGEEAVLQTIRQAVVLRPSVIFGPEDQFFNRFAAMARFSPALPLIGGGMTRFQPVFVGDVAEAVARTVDGDAKPSETYELGGPEVLTFRECMEEMLKVIERKRWLVTLPWSIAMMKAAFLERLPGKLLTRDQVRLLRSDVVVSDAAKAAGLTLEGMGITPRATEAILPSYLWQYRAAGQFTKTGHA